MTPPKRPVRPYPWKESPWAECEYLSRWRLREWQDWFAERLKFPFQALAPHAPRGETRLITVTSLQALRAEEARRFGIYLVCPCGDEVFLFGATAVTPVDIASPNTAVLAEYRAYRDVVGPPSDTRNLPRF